MEDACKTGSEFHDLNKLNPERQHRRLETKKNLNRKFKLKSKESLNRKFEKANSPKKHASEVPIRSEPEFTVRSIPD